MSRQSYINESEEEMREKFHKSIIQALAIKDGSFLDDDIINYFGLVIGYEVYQEIVNAVKKKTKIGKYRVRDYKDGWQLYLDKSEDDTKS